MPQPADPDPLAHHRGDHVRARRVDDPDDLVAWDQREHGIGELTVEEVQVGAAHGARAHREAHLAGAGEGKGEAPEHERGAGPFEDQGAHGVSG